MASCLSRHQDEDQSVLIFKSERRQRTVSGILALLPEGWKDGMMDGRVDGRDRRMDGRMDGGSETRRDNFQFSESIRHMKDLGVGH